MILRFHVPPPARSQGLRPMYSLVARDFVIFSGL